MRDYKDVKVPRSYRASAKRAKVNRVQVGRIGKAGAGIKVWVVRVLTGAVIGAAVWLGWQAYRATTQAKMFQVAAVDVKGVQQLSGKDLKEIVGGLTGRNIFRADLESAVSRARAKPWVRDVRIYRRLPNRISLVVAERTPAVILDTVKTRYLMEQDGTVIARLAKENEAAWPLPVVVVRNCRPRPGEQVDSAGAQEALTLLSEISLRGGWMPAEVTILADSPESLTVVYAGHEFRIGSGNYGEKFRRLAEVMADVKERGLDIAYVDLRPERQAAVMVRKEKDVRSSE